MTRDETKKIVMIIASTYPNWHPADLSFTVDAWASMLESFKYAQIAAALKAFILSDTGGFAPSVGQLIGMLDKLSTSGELSASEAWNMVAKAIKNGNYGSEAEFEKLPEAVQRVVGTPAQLREWAQVGSDINATVTRSNFIREYRAKVERERELRKIPVDVRTLLKECDNKLCLEN